ncbi:MAG: hypothetical protein ABI421_05735 [Polyangiaceae bacterium]
MVVTVGAYYPGDELSVTPDFMTELAEWIADSAARVHAAAGARGVAGLVSERDFPRVGS